MSEEINSSEELKGSQELGETSIPEVPTEEVVPEVEVEVLPEEETTTSTEIPEFTEPTVASWETMRDYLSQSTEVEPEIRLLMDKYAATHAVKVYKSEEEDYWEVYLVHNSSLPTNQTCATLRVVMGETDQYGYHKRIKGTKAEVLATAETL